MFRFLSAIFIFCFISLVSFAQDAEFDKTIIKANKLIGQSRLKEADEMVQAILDKYPYYGEGWDFLAKLRLERFRRALNKENAEAEKSNISVSKQEAIKPDSTELDDENLNAIVSSPKLSYKAYSKFIYTLRMGTMKANDAYYCSQLLRTTFIDEDIDSLVTGEALKFYKEAEAEFEKHNYHDAIILYKKALDIEPDFYKAALYMGDCFYYLGNYKDAMSSFKEVIEKHPQALEPRKYLIDTFLKVHLFDKALESAVASMPVYPDQSVAFAKFGNALRYADKKFDTKWVPRGVFPNDMQAVYHNEDPNAYKPDVDEFARDPWNFYRNALSFIAPFCDKNGIIIKDNNLTKSKYLEVYSWELMIKSSKHPWLDAARKMQEDGYLDCYVMITCFHFDFYEQYRDFVANNKTKIDQYFKRYIVDAE